MNIKFLFQKEMEQFIPVFQHYTEPIVHDFYTDSRKEEWNEEEMNQFFDSENSFEFSDIQLKYFQVQLENFYL